MRQPARILFLDQSGNLGGAELCLLDIAAPLRDRCLVGLFSAGPFGTRLEQAQIPAQVVTNRPIRVRKDSSFLQGLGSLQALLAPIYQVAQLSCQFDLIYANTLKALIVGAIASLISRRPLVYHLHDILSTDHFSRANLKLAVTFANRASLIIANSQASQAAFIAAGGRADRIHVVYNGFPLEQYHNLVTSAAPLRHQLNVGDRFVVGHFSRLSPWKGQHVLLEALAQCPENITALLVGDALFNEQDYVTHLHQQVKELGLSDRVQFLGFRSDIPQLMAACDLITHTSTAPEPFGRVIVEAMLCGTPVIAAAAGGAMELVDHGKNGWLAPPGDWDKLAALINRCANQPEHMQAIAHTAHQQAIQKFNLDSTNHQIYQLIQSLMTIN